MSALPKQKYESEWEPFIPYADESKIPAFVKPKVDALKKRFGMLTNSMRLYLHVPRVLDTVLTMTENLLAHPDSKLPRLLKIKLGLICSSTNGCVYCTSHQCSLLTRPKGLDAEGWGLPDEELQAIVEGRDNPADEIERVCFEYARTASRDPNAVDDALRARMAKTLGAERCIELAGVVGFWKFINTIHDSLHIPMEPSNLRYSGLLDAWKKRA
jgi:alkylhydroperoxidase family enzyme